MQPLKPKHIFSLMDLGAPELLPPRVWVPNEAFLGAPPSLGAPRAACKRSPVA